MLAYRDNRRTGGDTIMAAALYGVIGRRYPGDGPLPRAPALRRAIPIVPAPRSGRGDRISGRDASDRTCKYNGATIR